MDHKKIRRYDILYRVTFFDQPGMLKIAKDLFRRKTLVANITSTINSWATLSLGTRYSDRFFERPQNGFRDNRFGVGGLYSAILSEWPIIGNELRYPDGSIGYIDNNYGSLKQSGTSKGDWDSFVIQPQITIEPIKGWTTTFRMGFRRVANDESIHYKPNYIWRTDGTKRLFNPNNANYFERTNMRESRIYPRLISQYENTLGNHYFKVLGGVEQEKNSYSSIRGSRARGISELTPSISTGTGDDDVSETRNEWITRGLFANLNYDFAKRYLLNATVRRDGSSKFAKGKRWGTFFSFGFGYNVHNEKLFGIGDFLKNNSIDQLKIRVSSGQVGNQRIGSLYGHIETIPIRTNVRWINSSGERDIYADAPGLVNDNATWETVQDYNYGLDFKLFGKLSGEFTYYNRYTNDMLGPIQPLPPTLGASTPRGNAARLLTRGWEVSLTYADKVALLGDHLAYDLTLNVWDNKSKILEYYNPTGVRNTWYEGQNIGEIWGYETVGIMDATTAKKVHDNSAGSNTPGTSEYPNQNRLNRHWQEGDIRYKDLNGDGKISSGDGTINDTGDLKVIGNNTARYRFSLQGNFRYKNFGLSFLFQGTAKRDLWLGSRATFGFNGMWWSTLLDEYKDYWKPDNKDAFYPRPYFNTWKNQQTQTKYLADGSFIRLRNINLSYNLDARLLKFLGMKSCRLFATVENLFTITNMPSIVDPEYERINAYPLYRTYSLGLNLSF